MNYREIYRKTISFMHRQGLTPLVNVLLFAVITYGFHLFWRGFLYTAIADVFARDASDWLAQQVFRQSLWFNVQILGLNIVVDPPSTMWFNDGFGYITVNRGCSGLKHMYQLTVLFLLFPGPWKHKLWFIPMGMVIMFYTNVFRIIALSLVLLWWPDHWDFAHDWILRPFFYVVLFALWVWWVERYGGFFREKVVAPTGG